MMHRPSLSILALSVGLLTGSALSGPENVRRPIEQTKARTSEALS